MKHLDTYLAVPLGYLLVTGLIPYVIGIFSSCWRDASMSVSYDVCNVGLLLRYYSWLSLLSMSIVLLTLYLVSKQMTVTRLITVGILLSLIAIVGFRLYIPVLERDIVTVPRYASEQTF